MSDSALLDILPPDRSDAAPITTHLRGLLEQLHNGQGERPRITITLDSDAWAMLEAQFRRPYRPHSSYMYLPLDVGTVAFERKREATVAELAGLLPKGFVPPLGTPYRHPLPEPDPPPAPSPSALAKALDVPQLRTWDASAIEAKAAEIAVGSALADELHVGRPADAIYTAPMTGAEATYGGPWKGDGK